MDWTQTYTIIGANVALIGFMATLVIWSVNKLDADVKSIGNRMDAFDRRMDGHARRIDQLYQMFCDLLKERK